MGFLRHSIFYAIVFVSQITLAQDSIEMNHRGLNLNSAIQTLEQANTSSYILSNEIKKNNVNVVLLWASWCDVCKGMMPKLYEKYQNVKNCSVGLHFIAIKDTLASAKKDLAQLAPGHSTLIDEKGFLKNLLNIKKIPTVLILDSSGNVLEIKSGGSAVRFPEKMSTKYKDRSCAKQ